MTTETDLDAPFAPDWVLVPRVPTDAMLRAAQSAWLNDPQRRTTTMWSAMLAAAPSPAAAPQQPAEVGGAKETDLWRCTVCGRVGAVGRCCGEETREPYRPNKEHDAAMANEMGGDE